MSQQLRFAVIFVCFFLLPSFSIRTVNFINDDLKAGLNQAANEGKLVFVEFWASYCTPCKVMEEYTYTNQSVIERLTSSCVAVKINIQTVEGFDLKNQYKVNVLPTILILDSKGHLLGRYEETLSATRLCSVLEKYDVAQNRTRPSVFITKPAKDNPLTNNHIIPPSEFDDHSVNIPRLDAANSPVPKPVPSAGFTVQIGAYGLISSAQYEINKLKTKVGDQKLSLIEGKTASGKITYRILVGNFSSRAQAEAFRKRVGLEGFVRSFSDFSKK